MFAIAEIVLADDQKLRHHILSFTKKELKTNKQKIMRLSNPKYFREKLVQTDEAFAHV